MVVETAIVLDTARAHESLLRETKAREKYERLLPQQLVDDVMLDPEKEIRPGGDDADRRGGPGPDAGHDGLRTSVPATDPVQVAR